MKQFLSIVLASLILSCSTEETPESCHCGDINENRFTGNSITTQKTVFETSGYQYQFCSSTSGDLTSGFALDGEEIDNCSSLLKTVGFDFSVKSDALGSFTENSLGADLIVIVVDDQDRVLELIHPSNSTWTSSSISGNIQAKGSIASYWSTSLQYHYVYFIGADGGLYATFKDASSGNWTDPNNLLPLVGLSNNAAEIILANISPGTAGDDLFISFKTSAHTEIRLAHLSTEAWKVL